MITSLYFINIWCGSLHSQLYSDFYKWTEIELYEKCSCTCIWTLLKNVHVKSPLFTFTKNIFTVSCDLFQRWLEICGKKTRKPPKCELCRYQYHRHKKFKVTFQIPIFDSALGVRLATILTSFHFHFCSSVTGASPECLARMSSFTLSSLWTCWSWWGAQWPPSCASCQTRAVWPISLATRLTWPQKRLSPCHVVCCFLCPSSLQCLSRSKLSTQSINSLSSALCRTCNGR